MANSLLSSSLITKNMLALLLNNVAFLHCRDRSWETEFIKSKEYRPGDTVSLRKQNFFNVGDGATITPQDTLERAIDLTINHQFNVGIQFTSKDLTLTIDEMNERYLEPAAIQLAQKIDTAIAAEAVSQVYQAYGYDVNTGAPDASISAFSEVNFTRSKMTEMAIQMQKRYLGMSTTDFASLSNSFLSQFTPAINEDISLSAQPKHFAGFDIFENVSVFNQLAGTANKTGGTVGVNIPAPSLAGNPKLYSTSITLAGMGNALTINVGDILVFPGIKKVNPVSKSLNGQDFSVVVTSGGTTAAGGGITITVAPYIIFDPTSPYQNVSAQIVSTQPVVLLQSHKVNLAFQKQALVVATPPLVIPDGQFWGYTHTDPDTGISLRILKYYTGNSDQEVTRCDVLCGIRWLGEYAYRYPTTYGT